MAAGFRSPLFLLGIAAAPITTGSVRSLLAPWMGGASAPSPTQAGFRSFLAPWIGGACGYAETPVTPPYTGDGNQGAFIVSGGQVLSWSHQYPDDTDTRIRDRFDIQADDKELLELTAVLAYTINVWQRNG